MANGHELPAKYGVVFQPDYRLVFYAADGSVLTPRPGSGHSDPFQVTTEKNPLPGWKDYLSRPEGRRGRFDLKTGHSEQGELQARVVDARLGVGNASRWVTSFLADAQNYNLFKGTKAVFFETLDGGDTWHEYFTGIVSITEAPDVFETGPYYVFTIQDYRVQEYRKIFVGPPHRSVTYAMPAPLFPIGVPKIQTSDLVVGGPLVGWNNLEYSPPCPVLAKTNSYGEIYLHTGFPSSGESVTYYRTRQGRLFATEALASAADPTSSTTSLAKKVGRLICTNLRLKIRPFGSTDPFKEALVGPVMTSGLKLKNITGYDGATNSSPIWIDAYGMVNGVGVVELPTDHPDYISITSGTQYEIYIIDTGAPSAQSPLLISLIEAKTLWQDIAAGKFGFLDDNGDVIGAPLPLNAADFAAFPDVGKVRFCITGPEDLQAFLETQIFRTRQIAARVNYDGTISPIRTKLDLDGATPIDIPAKEILTNEWKHGEDTIRSVEIEATTFGFQDEVDLELQAEHTSRINNKKGGLYNLENAGGFITKKQTFSYLGARAAQFADEPEHIQITGVDPPLLYRFSEVAPKPGVPVIHLPIFSSGTPVLPYQDIAQHYLNWFEDGAAYLQLTCRRVGVAETVRQGDLVTVNADSLPNPSTNQRGGTRLGMVLERSEKEAVVSLLLIDAGPHSSPTAPSLGNPNLNSESGEKYPSVQVTLNTNNERAQVQFAVTETTQETVPLDTDTRWTTLTYVDETSEVFFRQILHNKRVWFRARTERTATAALPSGWVLPVVQYIDISPIPRASNLSLSVNSVGDTDATFSLNTGAAKARVYYSVHSPDQVPTYDDHVDVSLGSVRLSTAATYGSEISVLVEPRNNDDDPGPTLERSIIREQGPSITTYEIEGFIVLEKTDEYVVVEPICGPDTYRIWVYDSLYTIPVTTSTEPDTFDPTAPFINPGDSYKIFAPPQGKTRIVHFAPYSKDYQSGRIKSYEVGPATLNSPWFEYIYQELGSGSNRSDVYLRVRDPEGLGGYLNIWTSKNVADSPNPGGVPDGTLTIASTPATVGPSDSTFLDEVLVHPGRGKRVFFEFVNVTGISSGIRPHFLQSYTTLISVEDQLRDFSVHTAALIDEAVTSAKIQLHAVGTLQLAIGGVERENLVDGAINKAKVDAGFDLTAIATGPSLPTVKTSEIIVWQGKIYRWNGSSYTAAVSTIDIVGTIATAQIADAAITAEKIGNQAVTTTKLALASVNDTILAAGAVKTTHITDDAITSPKILAGSITGVKIAAHTITAANIQSATITAAEIAAGTITATQIAAKTITAGNIAALTITADLLAANTITGDKIAANTITATNIFVGTITSDLMAANSIIAGKIAAGAINAANLIVDGTITANKLAVSELREISPNVGVIVNGELRNAAGTRYINLNAVSGGAGTAGVFMAHDKMTLYADGTAVFGGTLIASTIISGKIVASGNIANGAINDPLLIVDGTIRANHLSVGSLSAITANVGDLTVGTLRNVANNAGIALSGYRDVNWKHYIALENIPEYNYFIYAGDASYNRTFSIGHNGDVFMRGKLQIGISDGSVVQFTDNTGAVASTIIPYDGVLGKGLNINAGGIDTVRVLNSSGFTQVNIYGRLEVSNGLYHVGDLSFFGQPGVTSRPVVTGSRGGNVALGNLLAALHSFGIINNQTT